MFSWIFQCLLMFQCSLFSYLFDLKGSTFLWGVEVKNAFQILKVFFTKAPLLIHLDLAKPFVFEINAFNFAFNVVLSQLGKDKLFSSNWLLFS
jgi:hypothetical protein